MPSRIIREGINSSSKIAALSMGADLLYRRLLLVVDDFGRYHGSVVTIRGACWPTNPEQIREKDVSKWLTELLKGEEPLVKTYRVCGATYLEVQNFGQKTRSKSRFPNPPWFGSADNLPANVQQMSDTCPQNADTSRIRISKANADAKSNCEEAPPLPPAQLAVIPRNWQVDETYQPFVAEWLEISKITGKPLIADDFSDAHFRWGRMDFEQKQQAINGLRQRVALGVWAGNTDPQYIPLPARYLEKEYKRPVVGPKPRDSPSKKPSFVEDVTRVMAERIARGEKPL